MLSIDEAISRERQQAKEQRSRIGTWDKEYSKKCKVYAEEHEQIAEWLEELKALREKNETLKALYDDAKKEGNNLLKHERNKALDDFVNFANTMPTVETEDGEIRPMWLEEMAEQLKEGEENEGSI